MDDPTSLTEAQKNLVVELYDASLSHIDTHLGQLIHQLKAEDLWDNTVVMITGDHGEELFEHGRYGHGLTGADNPFCDSLIHIPLILKLPYSRLAGLCNDNIVSQLDIPTTLCGIANALAPKNWLGKSLLTLFSEDSKQHRDEVLTQRGHHHSCILSYRTPEWKLIFNALEDVKRLYKLKPIANEDSDVGNEYPHVVTELYEKIQSHFNTYSHAYSERRMANIEIDEEMKKQLRGLGYLE